MRRSFSGAHTVTGELPRGLIGAAVEAAHTDSTALRAKRAVWRGGPVMVRIEERDRVEVPSGVLCLGDPSGGVLTQVWVRVPPGIYPVWATRVTTSADDGTTRVFSTAVSVSLSSAREVRKGPLPASAMVHEPLQHGAARLGRGIVSACDAVIAAEFVDPPALESLIHDYLHARATELPHYPTGATAHLPGREESIVCVIASPELERLMVFGGFSESGELVNVHVSMLDSAKTPAGLELMRALARTPLDPTGAQELPRLSPASRLPGVAELSFEQPLSTVALDISAIAGPIDDSSIAPPLVAPETITGTASAEDAPPRPPAPPIPPGRPGLNA